MSASITEKVEEGGYGCENENVGYAPAHGAYRTKKGFASFETNSAKLEKFRMQLKGVNAEDSIMLRRKHADMTEQENAKLTTEKTVLQAAKDSLAVDNQTLTQQLVATNAKNEELTSENTGLTATGNTCQETLSTKEAANDTLTSENAELTSENAELTSEKTVLQTAKDGLAMQNQTLNAELDTTNAKNEVLTSENTGLTATGNTCQETLSTKEAANDTLTSENAVLKSQKTDLETTNLNLTTQKDTLTGEISAKDERIHILASEIEGLKRDVPSQKQLVHLKLTAKLERDNELLVNLHEFHQKCAEKMKNIVNQIKSLENGDKITTVQETKLLKLKADVAIFLSVDAEQQTYDQAMAAWIKRDEQPPNYPLNVNYGNDHEALDANAFIEHYLENGGEHTLGDINWAKLADVKLISHQALTDVQIISLLYKIGFRRDGFGALRNFLEKYCDGESLLDERDVRQDVIQKDPATSPTPPGPHAPVNSITVMANYLCLELWNKYFLPYAPYADPSQNVTVQKTFNLMYNEANSKRVQGVQIDGWDTLDFDALMLKRVEAWIEQRKIDPEEGQHNDNTDKKLKKKFLELSGQRHIVKVTIKEGEQDNELWRVKFEFLQSGLSTKTSSHMVSLVDYTERAKVYEGVADKMTENLASWANENKINLPDEYLEAYENFKIVEDLKNRAIISDADQPIGGFFMASYAGQTAEQHKFVVQQQLESVMKLLWAVASCNAGYDSMQPTPVNPHVEIMRQSIQKTFKMVTARGSFQKACKETFLNHVGAVLDDVINHTFDGSWEYNDQSKTHSIPANKYEQYLH